MTEPREITILKKASKALGDGRWSFDGDWIAENHVTGEEIEAMNEFMEGAVRLTLLYLQRGAKRRSKKESK